MTNGEQLIKALCDRLDFEGRLLYDANILNLLRTLDAFEMNELVTFGRLIRWHNDYLSKNVDQSELLKPTEK
jgi:hypothetical protein